MLRTELLHALELVAPALAQTAHVPVLTHILFTGRTVIAHNTCISIEVPLVTSFKGAVPGGLLLSMLKASHAKEVEFSTAGEGSVLIKASTARIVLPFLPAADFGFEMPKLKAPWKASKEFLTAVKACLRSSMVEKEASPEQRGITVIKKDKNLLLFSTDRVTITCASIPAIPNWVDERIIIPTLFCEQMVELAKDEQTTFEIPAGADHMLVKAGSASLYGQLIDKGTGEPLDFIGVYNRFMEPTKTSPMIPIPKQFHYIFDRAVILAETKTQGEGYTTIYTRDGKMFFTTKSDSGGEVKDSLNIKHPEVNVKAKPKQIKSGLKSFTRMLITDKCIIMNNDISTHMIAAMQT